MFFKLRKTEEPKNHTPTVKEISDKIFKQMFPYAYTEDDFDADLKEVLSYKWKDLTHKSFTAQIKEARLKEIDLLIETVKLMPIVVFERDKNGNTPLHEAVLKAGFEQLIVEIVNAGAEIEARNNLNQTPADIAISPTVSAGLTRHAAKQKAFMQQEAVYCKKEGFEFSANKNETGDAPHIAGKEITPPLKINTRQRD